MRSGAFITVLLAVFLGISGFAECFAAQPGNVWDARKRNLNVSTTEFALGAAVGFSTSPYKSYDHQILPLPVVTYDSDRFYIKGAGLGVHLLKNETQKLSVGVSYFGLQFRPRKTDARELKVLNKRRSTMMADVTYSLTTGFGQFRAKASQDVLGNSDGFIGDLSFRIPIIRNDTMTLAPGVGVEWANKLQNDYYFGVSRTEARRGTVPYYKADDSFTPYFVLEGKFNLTESWSVFAGARLDILSSKVKDSPMVGKSCTVSVAAGVEFKF